MLVFSEKGKERILSIPRRFWQGGQKPGPYYKGCVDPLECDRALVGLAETEDHVQ